MGFQLVQYGVVDVLKDEVEATFSAEKLNQVNQILVPQPLR